MAALSWLLQLAGLQECRTALLGSSLNTGAHHGWSTGVQGWDHQLSTSAWRWVQQNPDGLSRRSISIRDQKSTLKCPQIK